MYVGGGGGGERLTILCFLSADLYKTILVQKISSNSAKFEPNSDVRSIYVLSCGERVKKKSKKECNIL